MYLTVDVEEWFNILDVPGAIPLSQWGTCENRLERNVNRLLELFEQHHIHCTMFWLGFFAQKYPHLVRLCCELGHEIACHGYGHILVNRSSREAFREDISRAKAILEDVSGHQIKGFRAPGFSVTDNNNWFFEEIRAAGFLYDSSVFPAPCGHGGILTAPLSPYPVQTGSGSLLEIPQSIMDIGGKHFSVFGGGYMRLAPLWLIRKGARQLAEQKRPLIVYVHPREIDPAHPRLKMSLYRHFKSYVNLKSTYSKLEWFCRNFDAELLEKFIDGEQQ